MSKALDRVKVWRDFRSAVNMTAGELAEWLETDVSRQVGSKPAGGDESIGHASGRRILAILREKGTTLSEEDYAFMRKVAGFVARHRAQEPANKVTSRWRYSLMNWGHDPLQERPE